MQTTIPRKYIYIYHILVVAPFLAYIGANGSKTDPRLFQVLIAVSVLVIIYHGYSLAKTTDEM